MYILGESFSIIKNILSADKPCQSVFLLFCEEVERVCIVFDEWNNDYAIVPNVLKKNNVSVRIAMWLFDMYEISVYRIDITKKIFKDLVLGLCDLLDMNLSQNNKITMLDFLKENETLEDYKNDMERFHSGDETVNVSLWKLEKEMRFSDSHNPVYSVSEKLKIFRDQIEKLETPGNTSEEKEDWKKLVDNLLKVFEKNEDLGNQESLVVISFADLLLKKYKITSL